jgi:murein DD-endopeptidase MepM/ murein hydrolase activator NlpD
VQHVKQLADSGGNHVVLEISPDIYAFYAHFQPGSITVAAGDRVAAGDVLGLLGNTGQTTAPHLHVLVVDSADPFTGNSLPMLFDDYTLVGTITSAAFAAATTSAEGVLVPEGTPHQQTATMALSDSIPAFP